MSHLLEHELDGTVEFDLGSDGQKYLQRQLDLGHELAVKLAFGFMDRQGDCFTVGPPGTDRSQLSEFTTGGVMSRKASWDSATKYISRVMADGDRMLIAECSVAVRTWKAWGRSEENSFTDRDHLYLYAFPSHGIDGITEVLADGDAIWKLNAWVCNVDIAFSVPKWGEQIPLGHADAMLLDAALVINTAYDGEGFVYFSPSGNAG